MVRPDHRRPGPHRRGSARHPGLPGVHGAPGLEARKALRAWLAERERHPYADDPHLFLGQRGPLSGAGIYRIITKYGRMADIEGLTPHTLRHTFAKNLIDAGTPLTVVAALMGHEGLDTPGHLHPPQ